MVLEHRRDESEVWLGEEEFQYRAYVIGPDPREGRWQLGERGLRIAQGGGREAPDAVYEALSVGRFGLAQSEYYFDGREGKDEWLWRQRWRARLRRFRVPSPSLLSVFVDACTDARGTSFIEGRGGICEAFRGFSSSAVSAH